LNLVLVDAGEVSGLGSIREYDECLIGMIAETNFPDGT